MQLSTYLSHPGLRRATAGAAALLLACTPLVACSSDSDDNPLGIPTYDPEAMASAEASESAAAAAASASAAASAEAAGVVTAESLSTDRYEVTSIPEDLDEQQTEILKAFINYDQVTWNIWFTRTGVENAEPLMTAEAYQTLKVNYENAVDGRTDGTVRISVISVFLTSPYDSPPKATVEVCDDQTNLVDYDVDGNDVSNPETLQQRFGKAVTMVYEDGTWKAADEQTLSANECVA
ncbi:MULTISPECIES: hypothetical protein [unclassified Actinomyces]|uniref:hypothetical protein n=1 Tax=unclassified Actinomyces TaxID=2609248 RepID=UPI000D5949B4|nr:MULTISPECIES: hypothetical protein [unclassified Actinomyces]RAX22331.1 hypothetical protein DRB07_08855 [Actinomyces sp. Z3]RAX22890.1 hypothetical protein DRB06_03340 [Actinomyces sp. Z5]